MEDVLLWSFLGIGAGVVTTVAGLGGGMMLILALSWAFSPELALAATAPALLLGNLHRLWMYRRALFGTDTPTEELPEPPNPARVAALFAAVAVPASFIGGLAAVSVPAAAIRWLLLAITLLAVLRELGVFRWRPSPAATVPAAALAGFLSAAGGGGGLVMAPTLLATGLKGERFIVAGSLAATMIHVARIPAYALGGWFTETTLVAALTLALSIMGGNFVGRAARSQFTDRMSTRVIYGTLVVSVALAFIGVTS